MSAGKRRGSLASQMDALYRELPPADLPWNLEGAPAPLVELVESGAVPPCAALDLGCGAGNAAVWLAARGFRVVGVDCSLEALRRARSLAAERRVELALVVLDLARAGAGLAERFDLAYDWEVLHHVEARHRPRWARNVHRMLRPGGRYLSVSFSERDAIGGGRGKLRRTPLGTLLRVSSEEEVRTLFAPLFEIERLDTLEVAGKRGTHLAVRAWMAKR